MLVGPMKKRIFLAGIVGFLIMFLIAGMLAVIGYKLYDAKNTELEELRGSKKEVYVINRDIKSTEEITMADTVKKEIDIKSVPSGAYTDAASISGLFNAKTFARIDLKAGMVITADMVYKDKAVDKDIRIQELNMVLLPSQLQEGSYVDIRFMLPTGNDYVVISKARVMKTTDKSLWLNLGEIERLRMSSAVIESYLTQGSLLYAIEYSDAPQQDAAEVTYDVLRAVMDLLKVCPNIASQIERNNVIALDDNYDTRRSLFDNYASPYIVKNTDDEPNNVAERLDKKISEQIKVQQEERTAKLESDAAATAAEQGAAKQ